MKPRSAYVHIPFCRSKCLYCDFNSYAGLCDLHEAYTDALLKEIKAFSPPAQETVYFGGGTPTVLSVFLLEKILSALPISKDAEVTVEANPATADFEKLKALRGMGFNRLSLGVQSFDDNLLKSIGRIHSAQDAVDTYFLARRAGFGNIGLDLIFALPSQTMAQWQESLRRVIELAPQHVSVYELSVEENTPFYSMKLDLPDEDMCLGMYLEAENMLSSAGYIHYEVSNYAKSGFKSRHNSAYWRNLPYYGFGAGASSCIDGIRAKNVCAVPDYIARVPEVVESSEKLTGKARVAESVGLALRTSEGIDLASFEADVLTVFPREIEKLKKRGLLEIEDGHMRVTHEGLLFLNDVTMEFMS